MNSENTTNTFFELFKGDNAATNISVLVILFIVGVLFLWYGNSKGKVFIREIGIGLSVAVIIIFIFVGVGVLSDILLPLASVTAAVVAVLSLDLSRRIRKETLEKENRDRKERYLNEIINWANDVNTNFQNLAIFNENPFDTLSNLSRVAMSLSNKGWSMRIIAEKALKNDVLKKSITDTGRAVVRYGESCNYLSKGIEGGEFLMMNITKNQQAIYTRELDIALASYKRDINIKDIVTIEGKLAENMRDKAIKTLDMCISLKSELLK